MTVRFHPLALALVGALFASGSVSAQVAVCSTSWTNASGGVWTDAASWDNGVPGAADDACITLDGTYTVTLDVNSTVTSLTLGTTAGTGTQTLLNTNRTLTMSAPSAIQTTGVYDWQGGNTGAAGTLTNDGRIEISGADTKDLGGSTTIRNQAVTTFDGTGTLRFLGGTVTILNTVGATFDLLSDADFSIFNGGNTFTNEGLFRKTGGTDVSQVSQSSLAFDNAGTVEAQTGTIRFNGNGTHTDGTFTASAGAEVLFDAGVHTLVGTMNGAPAGAVRMDTGATLVDDGSGATFDMGGTGFEWQSGYLSGTLTNVNLLRLTTADNKDIGSNAVLTNAALVEMTDTGVLRFTNGNGTFVNAVGATFDILSDADFSQFNGGNTFTNAGTLRKSGGADVSVVGLSAVAFDNTGTVEALTGTIRFDGSGTHTDGVFTAAAGAEVFFNTGIHTIVGTMTGTPAGAVRLDANATLTGGTLAFSGTGFEWQSGTFADVTNAGLLRLTTTGTKDIPAGATVTNTSLVEMTDTGVLRLLGTASLFVNAVGATFDIQSDADFTTFNGSNVFTNDGLVQKTGGTDVSILNNSALAFDNAGTVEALTGTLQFNGGGTHTDGVFTAAAGANVYFNAGTHTGTLEGTPAGVVRFDSGATLTDATLSFGGTGFEWQSGNFVDVTNAGLLRLTTTGTKDIPAGATVTNTSLVEMTDTGVLRLLGTASLFVNAVGATFDIQSDAGFITFNGGNTFTNSGLLRKSGGVGSSQISNVNLAFTNAAGGTVSAESGTLDVNGVFVHADGALVQGTATVDFSGAMITHDGDTGPGTSPGALAWTGAYTPSATSSLFIEIGGTTPGTEHDQLAASGAAALAGTLELNVIAGLSVGETFTILTASGVTGTFDEVVTSGQPGYVFEVTYTPTTVVVEVTEILGPLTLTGFPGWRTLTTPFVNLPLGGRSFLPGLLEPIYTAGYVGADLDQRNVRGRANVFFYDEPTGAFVTPERADPIPSGVGIWVYVFRDDDPRTPGTQGGFPKQLTSSCAGCVAETFPFSFGLSYTPGAPLPGINLVGNPAENDLNWDDPAWTRTNVSDVLYIYDPQYNGGDYRTWNGTTGTLPTEGVIPVGQGFHVEATGPDPVLTAPASAKLTSQSRVYRFTTDGETPEADKSASTSVRLNLRAAFEGRERETEAHIAFEPNAALGFDRRDARRLAGRPGAETLRLYSFLGAAHGKEAGTALQTSTLPREMFDAEAPIEIEIGAEALASGDATDTDATLAWEASGVPSGWTATLVDRATGRSYDLSGPGEAALALRAEDALTVTDLDDGPSDEEIETATEEAIARGEEPPTAPAPEARALRVPLAPIAANSASGDGEVKMASARFSLVLAPEVVEVPVTARSVGAPSPNPTRGMARLPIHLVEDATVRVVVYDVLGRQVAVAHNGTIASGVQEIALPTAGLAPGAYVVRVDGGTWAETRRLTVTR